MPNLILASKSPYKKELLSRLGLKFETQNSQVDESKYKQNYSSIQELAEILATAKAQAIVEKTQDAVIIGADQICYFEGTILSKTKSLEKSFEQLMRMQGKEHQLFTSYAILKGIKKIVKTNITTLKMRTLTELQVKNYLSADNPIDCAGSYKLELKGISLFDKIDTSDQTAIVGLPLISLADDLNILGFSVPPEH